MSSTLSDIIRTIDLEPATEVIRQAYHDQGYTGEFGSTAEFRFVNDRIELFAPEYTKWMLYGRGPGGFPPKEAIESWMTRYNITGDSWLIRRKIAEQGTEGNPFIDEALPKVVQAVKLELVPALTKAVLQELIDFRKKS